MAGAIDGATIGWVGPTFTITSIIWRQLKRATRKAWVDKSEQEKRIELPGGGSITVRSADNPDSLRGDGLDGLVIDEAAFVEARAWKESLRPALSDKQGWSMHISTPNGHNWFKEEFDKAADRNGYERWQRPTNDNPLIPQEELDEALLDMGPRAYAQEHGAQFCDIEGAEFSGAYFTEKIWVDEWRPLDSYAWRVMALDPSKGKTRKADYSAYVMLALDYDGKLWVDADLERRDVRQIIQDGIRIAKDFQPHAVGVESNQFQEVLADNYKQCCFEAEYMLPLHLIDNRINKLSRIRATLTPYLSRGEIRFVRSRGTRLLVQQLRDFPTGEYDDGPDALEMAVRLLKQIFEQGGTEKQDDDVYFEDALA